MILASSCQHVGPHRLAGTLTLKSNGNGLYFEINPTDTQAARDIRAILARPNEIRMSFAFSVAQGGERWKQEGDQTVRELLDVNLHDIALVVRPAYPQPEVALRSLNIWKKLSLVAYYRQKWAELVI